MENVYFSANSNTAWADWTCWVEPAVLSMAFWTVTIRYIQFFFTLDLINIFRSGEKNTTLNWLTLDFYPQCYYNNIVSFRRWLCQNISFAEKVKSKLLRHILHFKTNLIYFSYVSFPLSSLTAYQTCSISLYFWFAVQKVVVYFKVCFCGIVICVICW